MPTEATTPAPFEGETAINRQSGYARELLTKVVGSNPSIGQNEEIKSALSALEELVTRQGHVTVSTTTTVHPLINRALADVDPGKLERPPWSAVKDMLERALSKIRTFIIRCTNADLARISDNGIRNHLPVPQDAQLVRDI
jgi:hypothetical protein